MVPCQSFKTWSYIQYIIYICLDSWISRSVTTDILYSFSLIQVHPSYVSDSSFKTTNNTSFVSNYYFWFHNLFLFRNMEIKIVYKLLYHVFDYTQMCTFKHTCNTFTIVSNMPILLTSSKVFWWGKELFIVCFFKYFSQNIFFIGILRLTLLWVLFSIVYKFLANASPLQCQ